MTRLGHLAAAVIAVLATASVEARRFGSDALQEAQITAIQTGNIAPLASFASDKPSVRLAADLTSVAVRELLKEQNHTFQLHFTVTRESAELTSDFIKSGAERAVQQDPTGRRRPEADQNVKRLIDKMVDVARSEDGRIGEGTFMQSMKSLCPIWPFCD